MTEVINVTKEQIEKASGAVSDVHNNGLLCMFAKDDGLNYIAENVEAGYSVALKGAAEEKTNYICTINTVWSLSVTDSEGKDIPSNSDLFEEIIKVMMAALETKYTAPVLNLPIDTLNKEFLGKSLKLDYIQKAFDEPKETVLISLQSTGAYILCVGDEWRKFNAVGVLQVFGIITTTPEDIKRQMEAGKYDDDLIGSYSAYCIIARRKALDMH